MTITFHIVEQKDGTVALRQFADGTDQRDTVHCLAQTTVIPAKLDFPRGCILALGLIQRNLVQNSLPEMHEYCVHGHSINPCRKRRVPAKAPEFSEDSYERILR